MRKNCILIFTKLPLTQFTAGKIVNHFSNKLSAGSSLIIVTDFVWWEDRPHIGILQFESKKKVNDVLIALADQYFKTIRIDETKRIKVKAGFELRSLEWNAILPPTSHQSCSQSENTSNKNLREVVNDEDPSQPKLDNLIISSTPTQQCKLINMSSILCSDRPPPSPNMTPLSHPLQFEYWSIRKAMIIEDRQYENVTRAVHSLKLTLSQLDPNLEVSLFRNWFLKLKYPSANNDILLYVRSNIPSQNSNTLCEYIGNSTRSNFEIIKLRKEGHHDLFLKHKPSDLNIFLVTMSEAKGNLMEAQVCRLMEYMCHFDPRCYSLITLTLYWTTLNNINVGGKVDTGNVSELPPQYTIQWLVLFFMCNRKFIPNPQEILKRCGNCSFDLNCDTKYVEEWKSGKGNRLTAHQQLSDDVEECSEEFILSVLKLFNNFLTFCHSELGYRDKFILNLFNGILITKQEIWYKPATGYSHIVGMTLEQVDILQKAIVNHRGKQKLGNSGLYMTHPICLNQMISFSDDINSVFKLFGGCVDKLNKFLLQVEKFGVKSSLKTMGSLKEVLTVKT